MELLIMLALAVVGIPAVAFGVLEARWRRRWPERAVHRRAEGSAGDGAYRAAKVTETWTEALHGSAPVGVRVAAFTCFLEGATLIPGTLAWLLGALIAAESSPPLWNQVLVVAYLPGAVAAVLVAKAGVALLRGDEADADRATGRAATFAIALNAVLWAVSLLCYLGATSHGDKEGFLVPLGYAPLSIAQAAFTRVMFWRHRRHFRSAERDGAAPEFEAAA